jgi:hypothetical protein
MIHQAPEVVRSWLAMMIGPRKILTLFDAFSDLFRGKKYMLFDYLSFGAPSTVDRKKSCCLVVPWNSEVLLWWEGL